MMKILVLCILVVPQAATAEIVSRWTDSNGHVHYGDHPPQQYVESHSELVIDDTYDEAAYQAGMQRYEVFEKEQKARRERQRKLEKERGASRRYPALTESDKYDLYMERQDEIRREELRRKRERRADSRRKWRLDCYDPANAGKKACR